MKRKAKNAESVGLFKGILMAHSILLLHLGLLAALGCLVLFFRGIVQYMLWIFLGGSAMIVYSAYRIRKRMKEERKNLQDLLALPEMRNRTVEVSLLDGLASVRFGREQGEMLTLPPDAYGPVPQIEAPPERRPGSRIRELTELARLLESQLITLDEYNRTKAQLLSGAAGS
ncbi:MAG: hypothetical protein ACLFRG_00350 [Desulfococcaceae bacterium]